MVQTNQIRLPSWLNNKTVFQQKVPFEIRGKAAPTATITLEISKDPTDGRRVSKLDAEYGIILSLETTTSPKGDFRFSIPAYDASTDAYTFIFRCLQNTVTISDIRCGDVWVFLGNDFLSIPMNRSEAPAAPMKRQVMSHLRFFTPARNGIEEGEEDIDYDEKEYFKDASWIKITDTKELSLVSSSAFSFAYTVADQVHYPIGIVDLSAEDSTIVNWISGEALANQTAVSDYLDELGLLIDRERYYRLVSRDLHDKKKDELEKKIEEGKKLHDFDLSMDAKLRELEGETPAPVKTEAPAELDFPSSVSASKGAASSADTSFAKSLDFSMMSDIAHKTGKKAEDSEYIKRKFRVSMLYKAKLCPMKGMPIRGIAFSPDTDEKLFGRYDLLLMGLLETLADTFEPKEVYEEALMPSLLMVAMHPGNIDYDYPYKVLEFNENLTAFTRQLNMPCGMVSMHDLLLPDKTKAFTLGVRLAIVSLGIHITPKMPKSCPECIGVERAGNKLILKFDNLGDGLRLQESESELRGFAVCGDDRIFYPANARILHGVRVMVWRDDVQDPVSVTYGFSPFPHDATFRNLNDLPVMPFRFDRDPAFYSPDLFFASCDKLEFIGIKEKGKDFEKLKVFRTYKGNGVITADSMNKTEGSASLHIRYETENGLYGFEPVLTYESIGAPLLLRDRTRMIVDIFNPDTVKKTLTVEGFGSKEIKQQLTWQTLVFAYEGEGDISIESLKFRIEDSSKNGEIYVDNIRFE
ncbi:MAG: hypothetical protein IKN14_04245 [Clostridiales bacterium]|nr:hypothetical protein [Clostridiales bacterium]